MRALRILVIATFVWLTVIAAVGWFVQYPRWTYYTLALASLALSTTWWALDRAIERQCLDPDCALCFRQGRGPKSAVTVACLTCGAEPGDACEPGCSG